MEKQSTREALIRRIADLEAELLVYRNRPELTFASDAFSLQILTTPEDDR